MLYHAWPSVSLGIQKQACIQHSAAATASSPQDNAILQGTPMPLTPAAAAMKALSRLSTAHSLVPLPLSHSLPFLSCWPRATSQPTKTLRGQRGPLQGADSRKDAYFSYSVRKQPRIPHSLLCKSWFVLLMV